MAGNAEDENQPDIAAEGEEGEEDRGQHGPHEQRNDQESAPAVEPDGVEHQPHDHAGGNGIDKGEPAVGRVYADQCQNDKGEGRDQADQQQAHADDQSMLLAAADSFLRRRLSCCRITLTKQAKKVTNFCLRTGAANALTSSLAESENALNFHRRRTAITWTTSKIYFIEL